MAHRAGCAVFRCVVCFFLRVNSCHTVGAVNFASLCAGLKDVAVPCADDAAEAAGVAAAAADMVRRAVA